MQVLNVKAKLSNSGEAIRANKYQVNKVICLMDPGKTWVYGYNLIGFGNPEPSFFNFIY